MIAAEIQLRDEQLTAAGHDPECAAFDDKECSCEVGQAVPPLVTMQRGQRPYVTAIDPTAVTLSGAAADAFRRYRAATQRLQTAQLAFKAASEEFNVAHQAFADEVANG